MVTRPVYQQEALRLRKGDLDHIVDELSDDEGDEEAGERARAAMELEEDRQQTRNIITAVTEGHQTMRKYLQQKRRGKYGFDRLVGEGLDDDGAGAGDRPGAGGGGEEEEEVEEEELDEEELLQQGFKDRFEREQQRKARKGNFGSDDSDSEIDSDVDDNIFDPPGEPSTLDACYSLLVVGVAVSPLSHTHPFYCCICIFCRHHRYDGGGETRRDGAHSPPAGAEPPGFDADEANQNAIQASARVIRSAEIHSPPAGESRIAAVAEQRSLRK